MSNRLIKDVSKYSELKEIIPAVHQIPVNEQISRRMAGDSLVQEAYAITIFAMWTYAPMILCGNSELGMKL